MAAEKYLLLQSGRILTGEITHTDGRYVVRQPGAELKLREVEVVRACDSREDCLVARREQMRRGDSAAQLQFVEWCIREQFYEAAKLELLPVETAGDQSERVTVLRRRLAAAEEATNRPFAPPVKVASGDELDRMMRNLPEGTAEQFATTIQPLLINHCATAGCHGPSSPSDFHLLRAGVNSSDRRSTQRNLQSILAYIDREHLMNSPILQKPVQPHGDATSPVFTSRDASQYKQLAIWVQRISGAVGSAESDLMIADAAKEALTTSRAAKGRSARRAESNRGLATRPRHTLENSAVVPASAEEVVPLSEAP